ncbi:MAG: hypothetical protein JWN14_708 [Chthonomonadales bacterium]|nr:hypothetical protein [Chthonomonadales bacterium]
MSRGMEIRLAWAVLSAIGGGLWLWRARNQEATPTARTWGRSLCLLTLGISGFWGGLWLLLALIRLPYPFELEWIGGAMRDHCERVLAGQPLYVPPGPDWFPYEYPPLYFWVSALVERITGCATFVAMRSVSILSTLGCAYLLSLWVRRAITRSDQEDSRKSGTIWGWIAAGIFLATYRFTGAWYDAERLDMLFLCLSLLGIYLLVCATDEALASPVGKQRAIYACLSGLAFSLAFLTKQQAVLFMVGGGAALLWRREGRLLVPFALTVLLLCGGAVMALNASTHGWFGYYCFHIPLSNGIHLNLAIPYFVGDLPLYAPLIALLVLPLWAQRRTAEPESRTGGGIAANAVLIAMTGMGLLGSLISRAHWGGDQNVLMAGFIVLDAAACIAAGRWALRVSKAVEIPLYALLLAQFVTLVYRPDLQLPHAANRQAGEFYSARIHGIERRGEVLCLDHGGLTTPRHFQMMALMDVLNAEKRMPPAFVAALQAHRYAAIVTDEPLDPNGKFAVVLESYRQAESLNLTTPWVVTGFPTPSPGRPVWVYRPR